MIRLGSADADDLGAILRQSQAAIGCSHHGGEFEYSQTTRQTRGVGLRGGSFQDERGRLIPGIQKVRRIRQDRPRFEGRARPFRRAGTGCDGAPKGGNGTDERIVDVCTQAHLANEGLLEPLFSSAEDSSRDDGCQKLHPVLGALSGKRLRQQRRELPIPANPETVGSIEIAVADAYDANGFVPEPHGAQHGRLVFP